MVRHRFSLTPLIFNLAISRVVSVVLVSVFGFLLDAFAAYPTGKYVAITKFVGMFAFQFRFEFDVTVRT